MATERQVEMLTENSPEARVYRLGKLHLQAADRHIAAKRELEARPNSYIAKCRVDRTEKTLRIIFEKLMRAQNKSMFA